MKGSIVGGDRSDGGGGGGGRGEGGEEREMGVVGRLLTI